MRRFRTMIAATLAAGGAALALSCGGGGGGSYNGPDPTGPTTGSSGTVGATIHITANGVTPNDVLIEVGQKVRFINDDTRPHQIQTNPHLFHTDCPANNIAILNPGQQVETAVFSERKGCGFHNHLLPDTQSYWGVIRVGTEDHGGPVYSRGW